MTKLPPDFPTRFRQILTPFVSNPTDREALIDEAFFLYDPILSRVDLEGSARTFCIRLLKQIHDHCITHDEHALARLLKVVREDYGVNKHAEVDDLIGTANTICIGERPTSSPAPPTAPVTTPTQTIDTPRDERTPTVFISYSHQDADFAQQLIADLNQAGHACWIDTSEIKGGDEWIMTIAEGIINSYAFVPIVTLKALQSKWVQDEILWARQKDKLIIPVVLEKVLDHTRYFPLVSYQGITLFDSDYDTALPKLLSYLPSPKLPDVDDEREEEGESPEPAEEVTITAPRSVPRKLELAYLERLRLEELIDTEKYTVMRGSSAQRQKRPRKPSGNRAVFELISITTESADKQFKDTPVFEDVIVDVVEEVRTTARCVLLGEPGAGKTTTLWRLASDLVDTALNDRTAPIPVLIRLGKWTDERQSLSDFIASQMGDLGAYLDVLLREKRAALLLDGLNELPTSQRDTKNPQVQAFIEQYPDLLAVVSCRELDYTIDLGFDKVNITPLDPIRIREFAGRYLNTEKDPNRGDDLFWKLAGESAANWHRRFMDEIGDKLEQPERIFWIAAQLPEGITWGYTWRDNDNTYWHNWLNEREKSSSLMVLGRNPYMLLMLTSVYDDEGELPANRGQLFARFIDILVAREIENGVMTPDEQAPLVNGLAQVAYEMQLRRAEADTEGSNALTVLREDDVKATLGERLLYVAASASILSVGEQVRFTHQLLQEYFAATYMDIEIRAGRLQATDIWNPESWWEHANWEDATVLLVGLYNNDCSWIIDWINRGNPEVASRCVIESGAYHPGNAQDQLRQEWISRLTDVEKEVDPHARAAVGRALGLNDWDNRKGVSVIVRDDGVKVPDIDWVHIPAGEFIYQNGEKRILPAFEISRYLVTYVQFQAFIDDEEGFYDPRWWEDLFIPDDHNISSSDQVFKYWNHPRERVSWYDAIAFCRWLSWRMGGGYDLDNVVEWTVRLPTEFEWERVARSTNGFDYPWGHFYEEGYANINEITLSVGKYYLNQTSVVGMYPQGSSQEGVMDLIGNVGEWCLTDYENPSADATSEILRSDAYRVIRGGTWFANFLNAKATNRVDSLAETRDEVIGFRLCRSISC